VGALLAWLTTAASLQITMEIYISDWTHKFHHKTGLDAKANSELYKSNRVNSVYVHESLPGDWQTFTDSNIRLSEQVTENNLPWD
jgi:hypothetical protein